MRAGRISLTPSYHLSAARWKQKSITDHISSSLQKKSSLFQSRKVHVVTKSFQSFLRRVESNLHVESTKVATPSAQTNANNTNDNIIKVPFQYLSFYKYIPDDHSRTAEQKAQELEKLEELRRNLLKHWASEGVLGRIYLHTEGINAQMCVPVEYYQQFQKDLQQYLPHLMPMKLFPAGIIEVPLSELKEMFEHNIVLPKPEQQKLRNKYIMPFDRLHIRLRSLLSTASEEVPTENTNHVEMTNTGKSLPPQQWHEQLSQAVQNPNGETILIDVRNYHESEIGRFEGAKRIPVDRFDDTFDALMSDELLKNKSKDANIYLYCTGGIRCETVGAFLVQEKGYSKSVPIGFKNVNKLEGGINNYAQYIQQTGQQSLYKGKNFVFDHRIKSQAPMKLTEDLLSKCYSCTTPHDLWKNCNNPLCDILVILCPSCASKQEGHCSQDCQDISHKLGAMEPTQRTNFVREWYKEHPKKSGRPRSTLTIDRAAVEAKNRTLLQALSNVTVHSQPNSTEAGQHREYSTATEPRRTADLTHLITSNEIDEYCTNHSTSSSLLKELEEKTIKEVPKAHQMVGTTQGMLLHVLVRSMQAKRVLEIGTFTGYSALRMAEGLPSDGTLITCEKDPKVAAIAKVNFAKHKDGNKIKLEEGPAMDTLKRLASQKQTFDFIFLDGDKLHYKEYYDTIISNNMLNNNGILAVDNILWKGLVAMDSSQHDKYTASIHAFNEYVMKDGRTVQVMLPVRDGLVLLMKAEVRG